MVNLAVLGAGYWGKNLVRNFYGMSGVNLKYVIDRNDTIRQTMQNTFRGTQVIADYETALADPEVDAIVIATLAPSHFALAKQALEAGKHVYVEKPLTLSSSDARELVRIAEQAQRKLMVGHLMVYHSALIWMKDYIDRGEIGDILYMYAQRVNLGIVREDENALWCLGPHDISIILYLLDQEPVSVRATGECYLQDEVEDVAFVTLHFADRKMAQIHVSWLDPHKERKLTIVGTKRMIVFDDIATTEKVRIFDRSVNASKDFSTYAEYLAIRNGDIFLPHIPLDEPLASECAHFIECLVEDKSPLSDGREGLRVVKILEAAQASMKQGGIPMRLEDPTPA